MRRMRTGLVVFLFLLTSIVFFGLEAPAQAHETCFGHFHQPYHSQGKIKAVAGVHCTNQHDRYRIEFCIYKNGAAVLPCFVADTLTGWDAPQFHSQPREKACSNGLWYTQGTWDVRNNAGQIVHQGGAQSPDLLVNSSQPCP